MKTLDAGTSNAVGARLKKSLRKGNQGKDFIIDGRKAAGLTREAFLKGIDNAIRDRKVPSRVRGILKDGSIIEWPGI